MARISALFDDFDPSSGGALRYRHEPGDRVVLTFDGVPEWGSSNASRFQVELFDDGSDIIRLTFLDVAARDGIVGLSAGEGEPTGFAVPGVDFSDDYDPPPLLRATVLEADAGEWEPAENRAVVVFENEYPISIPLSVPVLAGGEAGPDDLVALPRSVDWPPTPPIPTATASRTCSNTPSGSIRISRTPHHCPVPGSRAAGCASPISPTRRNRTCRSARSPRPTPSNGPGATSNGATAHLRPRWTPRPNSSASKSSGSAVFSKKGANKCFSDFDG